MVRTHDVSRTRRTLGKLMDRPDPSPALETTWEQPEWMSDGVCADRSVDPELWFQLSQSAETRQAKGFCHRCPVRPLCLQYALVKEIRDGTWGGLSENELRAIFRARQAKGKKAHRGYDTGFRDRKSR